MNFDKIFSDSFDTFKVFHDLDLSKVSLTNLKTPKSIWQILNHLIIWQQHQLNILKGIDAADINELETWLNETSATDHESLTNALKILHGQIQSIKLEITTLTIKSKHIEEKLKIIQDLSVHLSFHLGEIVLMMRQNGHFPMPTEMKLFLDDYKNGST
ncbi:MAG: hypothetical protein M3512_10040 [Bacteroidota bacterium]|nr:hypothetical protein [Bacteroidota bacterium]